MEVLDKPKSAVAEYQPFYAQLAQLEAALAALVAGGIAEDAAKACIELIAKGSIPAVQINY